MRGDEFPQLLHLLMCLCGAHEQFVGDDSWHASSHPPSDIDTRRAEYCRKADRDGCSRERPHAFVIQHVYVAAAASCMKDIEETCAHLIGDELGAASCACPCERGA
jgi:hypothetical protein